MPISPHPIDYVAGSINSCADYEESDWLFYQALKAENHRAYSCLFLQMHNRFVPLACQRGGTYEEAVEVMNDCLAIFLQKVRLDEYTYQPTTKITTYVYSICYRHWLTYVNRRQQRREVPLEWQRPNEEEDQHDLPIRSINNSPFVAIIRGQDGADQAVPINEEPDLDMDTLEWVLRLKKALSLLREDCQNMLRWFYQEEISLRDISGRLGMSEQSAAVKRFKCAKYLRDKYKAL